MRIRRQLAKGTICFFKKITLWCMCFHIYISMFCASYLSGPRKIDINRAIWEFASSPVWFLEALCQFILTKLSQFFIQLNTHGFDSYIISISSHFHHLMDMWTHRRKSGKCRKAKAKITINPLFKNNYY